MRRPAVHPRIQALRQVRDTQRPLPEVARELALNPETLYRWTREVRDDPAQSFPGNGQLKDLDKEVEQLHRTIARLQARPSASGLNVRG